MVPMHLWNDEIEITQPEMNMERCLDAIRMQLCAGGDAKFSKTL
jgi:hypothetical protein